MSTTRRMLLATSVATFTLIMVGASVRASGAGLGCPDWPHCYGLWIPPTNAAEIPQSWVAPEGWQRSDFNATKTWIEYGNRLVGVTIGLMMLASTVLAWRVRRRRPDLPWLMTAALLLTGFQAWQGGQVVKQELDPRFVTVHLVVALAIMALLLAATVSAWSERLPALPRPLDRPRARLRTVSLWALGAVVGQVVLGALVRGTIDIVGAENPELARGERLAEVGLLDHLHRDAALLTTVLVAAVAYLATRLPAAEGRAARLWSRVALGTVLLQGAFGLGLAYGGLPPALQVLHIGGATALFSALFLVHGTAGRRPA